MHFFEDRLKISFQQVIDRAGFGFAVYLFEPELPKLFWKTLTYEKWLLIYMACPDGSELKQRALDSMGKLLVGNSEVIMSNT